MDLTNPHQISQGNSNDAEEKEDDDKNNTKKLQVIINSKTIKKPKETSLSTRNKINRRPAYLIVPRQIEESHKYFIRGDLIIDMKRIKQSKLRCTNSIDCKEFRPPTVVSHLKKVKFYTVDFGRIQYPIKDFSFLIDMLESLGDQQIHYIAMQLRKYKFMFELIDEKLNLQKQKSLQVLTANGESNETTNDQSGLSKEKSDFERVENAGDYDKEFQKILVTQKNKIFDISFEEQELLEQKQGDTVQRRHNKGLELLLARDNRKKECNTHMEEEDDLSSSAQQKYQQQIQESQEKDSLSSQQALKYCDFPQGGSWKELSSQYSDWKTHITTFTNNEFHDQIRNKSIFFDTLQSQNLCSLASLPYSSNNWSFFQSRDKAFKILGDIYEKKKFAMYSVARGTKDQYEMIQRGICSEGLRLFFGNMSEEDISKILLENGRVIMEDSLIDAIENKIKQHQFFLSSESNNLDDEFVTFKKRVKSSAINGYHFELELTIERYRLSNYKNQLNDYLILGYLQQDQYMSVANQLFSQKVFTDKLDEVDKEFLQNISYQAQSEFLIEKFYNSGGNKVPRFLQKKQREQKAQEPVKRAGFKEIE